MDNEKIKALKSAFPHTIPIAAGFLFLSLSYGILMSSKGFSVFYPICMSAFIYAGSMQFASVNLLLSAFNPLAAFILTLMVNCRHLFYGISMLNKYKDTGIKKLFLIFGLTDETFSINVSVDVPDEVDKGWFMFFVTFLNYMYWLLGTIVGSLLGKYITFNTEGIEFVLTALFLVIFINQWLVAKSHTSAIIGVISPIICLAIFGSENFMIPSLILILAIFFIFRKKVE
ncbi:AzlC family ABC transporter permease [Anaerosphaera multitolerans]|uniref:Branched-chain amino acid transporter AzlC n=1 Tax=Anaerosphaera multitolerans TaxID=2487351 RepID=A0A437S5Z9_9FIRM|nr:AzlC family ABC transporter permease [Anaerosphaera multitolerans]RVU54472.1 branched-chain amino acid transporter AzlC [Anaerosphaera multitolerans]